jgi:hypothetical protein
MVLQSPVASSQGTRATDAKLWWTRSSKITKKTVRCMVAILSSTNLYDTCQNLTVPSHKTHYEKVVFFICVPIISKLDSR